MIPYIIEIYETYEFKASFTCRVETITKSPVNVRIMHNRTVIGPETDFVIIQAEVGGETRIIVIPSKDFATTKLARAVYDGSIKNDRYLRDANVSGFSTGKISPHVYGLITVKLNEEGWNHLLSLLEGLISIDKGALQVLFEDVVKMFPIDSSGLENGPTIPKQYAPTESLIAKLKNTFEVAARLATGFFIAVVGFVVKLWSYVFEWGLRLLGRLRDVVGAFAEHCKFAIKAIAEIQAAIFRASLIIAKGILSIFGIDKMLNAKITQDSISLDISGAGYSILLSLGIVYSDYYDITVPFINMTIGIVSQHFNSTISIGICLIPSSGFGWIETKDGVEENNGINSSYYNPLEEALINATKSDDVSVAYTTTTAVATGISEVLITIVEESSYSPKALLAATIIFATAIPIYTITAKLYFNQIAKKYCNKFGVEDERAINAIVTFLLYPALSIFASIIIVYSIELVMIMALRAIWLVEGLEVVFREVLEIFMEISFWLSVYVMYGSIGEDKPYRELFLLLSKSTFSTMISIIFDIIQIIYRLFRGKVVIPSLGGVWVRGGVGFLVFLVLILEYIVILYSSEIVSMLVAFSMPTFVSPIVGVNRALDVYYNFSRLPEIDAALLEPEVNGTIYLWRPNNTSLYSVYAKLYIDVYDTGGLNEPNITDIVVALIWNTSSSTTPSIPASSILSAEPLDWRVDDRVLGYALIGYFNVSKDDVKIEYRDGKWHYIIQGKFWVYVNQPPGYRDIIEYHEETWDDYNSSGLFILILARDSDGNEIAWWYRVYAKIESKEKTSSASIGDNYRLSISHNPWETSMMPLELRQVVSRGVLKVVYEEGRDVAFRIDGGNWYTAKHPIGIVIEAYNSTFEVDGNVYHSETMVALCINSTRYTFRLLSPEEHTVEVIPYEEYHLYYEILMPIGIIMAIMAIGIIIIAIIHHKKKA